jgi:hypothetical protein
MFHFATETYTHMHRQHQQTALLKKEHTSSVLNIKIVEFCRSTEGDASESSVTSEESNSTASSSSTRKKWRRISQRVKLVQRQRQAQLEHRIIDSDDDVIVGSYLFCYDFDNSSVCSSLSLSDYDSGYNSSVECSKLDCRDCPTAIRVEDDSSNQDDEES